MIDEIRENISCPQFGDNHYGRWGALNLEQRKKIKGLLNKIDNLEMIENKYIQLQSNWNTLREINNEAREYLTSYEAISTIQGLDDIEKNKQLDEKTINEMTNRYLKVHDKLLSILDKMNELEGNKDG